MKYNICKLENYMYTERKKYAYKEQKKMRQGRVCLCKTRIYGIFYKYSRCLHRLIPLTPRISCHGKRGLHQVPYAEYDIHILGNIRGTDVQFAAQTRFARVRNTEAQAM